ncbi:MAG: ZIP family metal transporter [Salibacteraceae bacterium]
MTAYFAGLFAALVSGYWFILKPPASRRWISLFLAAGGAYLIAILFTHIIPELVTELPDSAGKLMLTGFLIQILLENYSKGIEHGHAHGSKSKTAFYLAFGALCVHAFIEGMPLSGWLTGRESGAYYRLLAGIMAHKIPVAITLATLMTTLGMKKTTGMVLLTLFIAATVAGTIFQLQLHTIAGAEKMLHIAIALTVGILLHVSTTILFESSDEHKLSPSRIAVIAVGVALGVLL